MAIWEAAIWLTCVLVLVSVLLQLVSKKFQKDEANKFKDVLLENKRLSDLVIKLQDQLSQLQREVLVLSEKNKELNDEVVKLSSNIKSLTK